MSTEIQPRPNLLFGSSLAEEVNNVTSTRNVCEYFFHHSGPINNTVIVRLTNWLKNKKIKFQKVIIIDEKTLFPTRSHTEKGVHHYCVKQIIQNQIINSYQSLKNTMAPYCHRIIMIEPPPKCVNRNNLNPSCLSYNEECDSRFCHMQGKLYAPETTPHLRIELITKEDLAHKCEYFDHTIDWSEVDIRQLTTLDEKHLTDHSNQTLRRYIIN